MVAEALGRSTTPLDAGTIQITCPTLSVGPSVSDGGRTLGRTRDPARPGGGLGRRDPQSFSRRRAIAILPCSIEPIPAAMDNVTEETMGDSSRLSAAFSQAAIGRPPTSSPLAEITVHHHRSTDRRSQRLRKAPSNLDEETLRLLLQYLRDHPPNGYVNDDDMTAFMIRMNRTADRQAEHQHSLMGDAEDSDTSLFNDILAEEQELAIGQAYFKEVVANLRRQTEYDLDARTLGWVRRASGLHRTKTESLRDTHSDHGHGKRAVSTRGSARQLKMERRDRGVHTLVHALTEVEEQVGPFEQVSIRLKRKQGSLPSSNEIEQPSKKAKTKRSGSNSHRPLVAKVRTRDFLGNGLSFEKRKYLRVSRMIVDGNEYDGLGDKTKEPPTTTAVRRAKRQSRNITAADLCLKRNLWKRYNYQSTLKPFMDPETKESYAMAVKNAILPTLKATGVQFRFPRWETLHRTYSSALDPPRERHSDDVYAGLSMKLLSGLVGSTRSWASREFFYSDIDREWFNRNELLEVTMRAGLARDVRLTMDEWKAIRCRVSKKPRRFSRRFVETQLEELRRYRARVRLLQRKAASSMVASIDFDIPAPIPFGTIVTAYSTKYKIILRGVVLLHEPKSFVYLILYDRREFGHEFCADYNVASHGGPSILAQRTRPCVMDSQSIVGSAKGTLCDAFRMPKVRAMNEINEALSLDLGVRRTMEPTVAAKMEAVRHVAENDTLVGLVTVVETAIRRKEILLEALEQTCEVKETESVAEQFQFALDWLKENLVRTNRIIEAALPKLRLMYGRLYIPAASKAEDLPSTEAKDRFVQRAVSQINNHFLAPSAHTKELVQRIQEESSQISETLSHALAERGQSDKRGLQSVSDDVESLPDLMGPVGSCLLATSYAQHRLAWSKTTDPSQLTAAAEATVQPFLTSHFPEAFDADDLFLHVQASHSAAVEDLNEAMKLLQTEIVLASAHKASTAMKAI